MTAPVQILGGSPEDTAETFVDYLMHRGVQPTVFVGPFRLYKHGHGFAVCSGNAKKEFRLELLLTPDEDLRDVIIGSLHGRRALKVMEMDDELEMVKACAALWPGKQVAAHVASLEAERAGVGK